MLQVILTDGSTEALSVCAQTLLRNGIDVQAEAATSEGACFVDQSAAAQQACPPSCKPAADCRAAAARPQVQLQQLRWGCGLVPAADVVLAADVVYDPAAVPALVQQLRMHVAAGAQAVVCSLERQRSTMDAFLEACSDAALQVIEIGRTSGSAQEPCSGSNAGRHQLPVHFAHCHLLTDSAVAIVLHRVHARHRVTV